ncbi:uncharacterized protein LOC129293663 [Prosopis cineraria]|uniref:uncharacterized protein LOC129293663 n=1 Tax=Prosopis cineraria TaxID=364024 RepID=UPI00240FAD9E|nr:uncharacterized protein LOC129293663 [Prosopis cineraria]
MKRKVDNDFSVSSSATKIRRLDADLPPIQPAEVSQQPPITPEFPSPASENQERALVLFKPVNHSPFFSPSSFSFTVDSDVVSAINNQRPWLRQTVEEEAICRDENNRNRLALVPWEPSQFRSALSAQDSNTDSMESEQMGEEASMDIEEQDYNNSSIHQTTIHGELTGTEGLQPWQQQHCLIPQLPQNTSTPISWTW